MVLVKHYVLNPVAIPGVTLLPTDQLLDTGAEVTALKQIPPGATNVRVSNITVHLGGSSDHAVNGATTFDIGYWKGAVFVAPIGNDLFAGGQLINIYRMTIIMHGDRRVEIIHKGEVISRGLVLSNNLVKLLDKNLMYPTASPYAVHHTTAVTHPPALY
jgi:hypothetical protein